MSPSKSTAAGHLAVRDKQSLAQRHLDPFDILSTIPEGTVEECWAWFQQKLTASGFDRAGLLISREDAGDPLKEPDSQLFGDVVSNEYMAYVRENPNELNNSRPYKILQKSTAPISFLGEQDYRVYTPSEKALAQRTHSMFHIEGWVLYPIHAPEKNRLYTIGWWDLHSQDNAQKLWSAESVSLMLAATYFCEALNNRLDINDQDTIHLSPRERECLLWAGAGKTTSEIGAILDVADGTIEEYFKRAAKKLGATTRAQACVKAVMAGLIHP